jgi:hypothetical protein
MSKIEQKNVTEPEGPGEPPLSKEELQQHLEELKRSLRAKATANDQAVARSKLARL